MGLKFYVSEAQSRISQAVKVSSQANQAVASLQQSIQTFLSAPLSGKAYDSARNYFMVAYTPICQSIIMTGEALVAAHKKFLSEYQGTVSSSDMDEDKINDEINRYKVLLNTIDDLIRLSKTSRPDLEKRAMNAYECMQKRQEKLEKFYAYNAQSPSFFNEYISSQKELDNGVAQVKNSKAFNPSSGTFDLNQLNMSWASSIKIRWKSRIEKQEEDLKLKIKMGAYSPNYEIRTVIGQYGEDVYEVYINGVLDKQATQQYNLDVAITKRNNILNSELSTSDKVIGSLIFLLGLSILTGGVSTAITGILGVFEGTGSVLVTLGSGATAIIPAVAVNKDAIIQTAEGAILSVGGAIVIDQSLTMMASVNQLNNQINSGKAPGGIKRVDKGFSDVDSAQDHIHFDDSRWTLNKDGTWGHNSSGTPPKLTKKILKWLKESGWKLPK